MGVLGDQVKGMITSAALYAALPDGVNHAQEVVHEMLPEDMKAAMAVTSITVSVVAGAVRNRKGNCGEEVHDGPAV